MNRRSNNRPTTRTKKTTTTRATTAATPARSSALSTLSVASAATPVRAVSTKAKVTQSSSISSVSIQSSTTSITTAAKRSFVSRSNDNINLKPAMPAMSKPMTTTFISSSAATTKAAPVMAAPKARGMQYTPQRNISMASVPVNKVTMKATAPTPSIAAMSAEVAPSTKMFASLMAYRAMSTASANDPRNLLRDPKEVESRILNVLKSFEKIDQSKLAPDSHFQRDLGLDSLDRVEVMLAVEEEFNLEFSDEVSDRISSVQEAVDHISKLPDHEFKFSV